ncbi:glycosyltransferase [Candidatus Parcubacteria bacterium]|nr:glycosyltransferase [Candidatus Parcubacteria bacterium]
MSNTKPKITIGIPALNEEANIGYLLESLLKQDQSNIDIEKIVVNSDGSTDQTVKIARNIDSDLIEVIDNKYNRGIAKRQNQIFEKADSDILVLLDADIAIKDKYFIHKLVNPIISRKADLSSTNYLAIKPKTIIEKALAIGLEIKNNTFKNYQNGDNLYTCHGTARAFSRKMYENFKFTDDIAEDMFSYLYAKQHNFKYAFIDDAYVYIKLPATINDHKKQSFRFIDSKNILINSFPKAFVDQEIRVPKVLFYRSLIFYLLKTPFYTLVYVLIYFYSRKLYEKAGASTVNWGTADSSKDLREKDDKHDKFSFIFLIRKIIYIFLGFLSSFIIIKKPRIIIFCYHSISTDSWRFSVSQEEFKKQIKFLLSQFKPVTLGDINKHIRGEEKITEDSFAINFDDGFADIMKVKDFLKKHSIEPTVFALADPDNINRREMGSAMTMLAPNQIKELARAGWEVGCHSATHDDFWALNSKEIKEQIANAKIKLEAGLGTRIKYFAYPRGRYNAEILKTVKASGYEMAVSMDDKLIRENINIYIVPRVGVDKTHSFIEFKNTFSFGAIFVRGIIKYFLKLTANKSKNKIIKLTVKEKIKMFFVNRLITGEKSDRLPLPKKINDYNLIDTIYRPPGDDQYQFGIYENEKKEKAILKMWDGDKKDGDWFWLINEIKTYQGLDELFKTSGAIIKEKFPGVKLPGLIKVIKTRNQLGLFMEMIKGETLDKENSMKKRVLAFEQVTKYFQHLGQLIARSGLDKKFVKRNNIHTVLIFFYMLLRCVWIYPGIIPKLIYSLFVFLLNLPYLIKNSDMAFVHRDLTYMNVMNLHDGRIGVIDFELAVLTNPIYEITQLVTGSWHLENFWQEFYKLDIMKEIFTNKNKLHSYKALTIFTAVHRLATSPGKEFDSHYSYLIHGLGLKNIC